MMKVPWIHTYISHYHNKEHEFTVHQEVDRDEHGARRWVATWHEYKIGIPSKRTRKFDTSREALSFLKNLAQERNNG
jgi:hypothetical protein